MVNKVTFVGFRGIASSSSGSAPAHSLSTHIRQPFSNSNISQIPRSNCSLVYPAEIACNTVD